MIAAQVSRLGDMVFYSYGCYDGTGGYFQNGGINYVRQDQEGNTVETGTAEPSDFFLSRPGAVVYIDGAIRMADEHQASYTTLIPEALAAAYGCANEDMEQQAVRITDVEILGDQVYYTVEKSSRCREGDIGWRECYRRESSERYKMTVGGDDPELLFSY